MSIRNLRRSDTGAALIPVIGIIAVMSILAATIATLSVNNLRNATRDKQSNSALATSEAGVAEAIEFIRSGTVGLAQLNCPADDTTSTACTANPLRWANPTNPMQVRVDGGTGNCVAGETCFRVWISTVKAYDPPLVKEGIYQIHSSGEYGGGPATRDIITEIGVKPYPFPIGVFAESLTGAGGAEVRNESLFTFDCVEQRQSDTSSAGGLRFNATGVDLQWDLPPTAHSVSDIVTNNNCNNNKIHTPSQACNTTFPYDQSGSGGSLTSTTCFERWTSPYSGNKYPQTSQFTIADLQTFGYRPRALSDDVYAVLKARAQASGTYTTDPGGGSGAGDVFANLAALGGTQAVLFFDVSAGQTVTVGPGDIPSAYFRTENAASVCSPSSLVVVVAGGDLKANSMGSETSGGKKLVTSVFVPDGAYDGAGNLPIIGTIFAKEMKLAGTADFRLDQCFVDNPPSSVIDIAALRFWEDDLG